MSTRAKEVVACMREIDEITKKYKLSNAEFTTVLGGLVGEMKRPEHIPLTIIVDRIHSEAVRFELFTKAGGAN